MLIELENGRSLDLDAPTLRAMEVFRPYSKGKRRHRWFVWCPHCRDWHVHKPVEGHHKAGCLPEHLTKNPSPYLATGYNLASAGAMTIEAARREYRRRRNFLQPQRFVLAEVWTAKGWNDALDPHPRDLLEDADIVRAFVQPTGETITVYGHKLESLSHLSRLTIEISERAELNWLVESVESVKGR